MASVELLGPISTTDLSVLSRCARKYMYRFKRGLVPKGGNRAMHMGTLWHQGAAAGYEALRGYEHHAPLIRTQRWLTAAINEVKRPDPRDRDNIPLVLEQDDVTATVDMLTYYWQHQGVNDEFDEILGIEEQVFFEVGGWRMRGTLDLRVRIGGFQEIWDHKGLHLDTPLPTPSGWTTMGEVQVGDEVFGRDGHPYRVTAKSAVKYIACYRLTFENGASVVCDEEHLWSVEHGQLPYTKREVLSAAVLFASREQGEILRVPTCAPLELPEAELPIEPYVLGVWIGDGAADNGTVCKPDDELFEHVAARGYRVSPPIGVEKRGRVRSRNVYGLAHDLRLAGLKNNKHIPLVYLRASQSQRLAFLQGLMDTDGSWNKHRNQAVFTTVNSKLAQDVHELASSLGVRVTIDTRETSGFGKTVAYHQVKFTPKGFNPFRLSRKADLVPKSFLLDLARPRYIRTIEEIPSVPTQCIAVASPDHTYLCGQDMIVTHNTSGDITQDMAHLPLDLQTHNYYLGAYKTYGELALRFCHNWQRRFDFGSKQRVGPPHWQRSDGTTPYLKTETGKLAARSNDPNDYVRRVHTPVSLEQLVAFERELRDRLRLLQYHLITDTWPRSDEKGQFGCGNCDYYGICGTEADGRDVVPAMLAMLFTKVTI